MHAESPFLFDLDGTLVDSVYQHVLAWKEALDADASRCRALAVGILSGGDGSEELRQAGAIRVYDDPADLLRHIDEIGGRH